MIASLAAALDRILPGGEGFPSAGEVDLAGHLAKRPGKHAVEEAFASKLPAGFANLPGREQTAQLVALEAHEPALFKAFLVIAYSGYYAHPAVLEILESVTDYRARPPQPVGYALEPFDEAMRASARLRPPHFRTA